MKRRLTTILAADIAGYSRLMRQDEDGTLEALKSIRKDIVAPLINKHQGDIIKLMGDGLLAEFSSVVEALRCAVEIQNELAERNKGSDPKRKMLLRMGVNLGDVIADDSDIYGDGVNVAARLEELAQPGGICVSDTVHQHVRSKVDVAFEDLGALKVKNIDEPIHVYRITLQNAAPLSRVTGNQPPSIPDRPSIAVLPFENLSTDPEQEYFAEGIADDILTALSRFHWLFVIARQSSFTYEARSADLKLIARELGVRYVIKGRVRRGGEHMRLVAQLIDATTGEQLWADRYDRDLSDVFKVQDEITSSIVSALGFAVEKTEVSRAMNQVPSSLDAYDLTLRSAAIGARATKADNEEAHREADKAIALDPAYARAYSAKAICYVRGVFHGWTDEPIADLSRARECARKAVSHDATDSFAHWVLGVAELWLRNHERAIAETRRATELNPNDADAWGALANALNFYGKPEEGLQAALTATRLNPHRPSWYSHILARSYFMLGKYDEAIRVEESITTVTPGYFMGEALSAASHAARGRKKMARQIVQRIRDLNPNVTLAQVHRSAPYKNADDLDHFVRWLRVAGLPE